MLVIMQALDPLSSLAPQESTPELICARIAEVFHVKETEVALLELRGSLLNFVYPVELRTAGAIPLSSSAVAARTAQSKRAELFNSFATVNHYSVFELVKLGNTGLDAQTIQKLMSAPVMTSNDDVLGVLQISRKGPRPAIAGPDFSAKDLHKLESVARQVARLMSRARPA